MCIYNMCVHIYIYTYLLYIYIYPHYVPSFIPNIIFQLYTHYILSSPIKSPWYSTHCFHCEGDHSNVAEHHGFLPPLFAARQKQGSHRSVDTSMIYAMIWYDMICWYGVLCWVQNGWYPRFSPCWHMLIINRDTTSNVAISMQRLW